MNITHKVINLIGPMDIGHIDKYPSIVIDGGDRHDYAGEILAHLGDFDSANNKPDILLDKLKDYSDFTYALSLLNDKMTQVHAHGLLGGRKDHEFSNFLETYRTLEDLTNLRVFFYESNSQCSCICVAPGKYTIKHNGIFSIFTLKNQLVTIDGEVEYKLDNQILNNSSSHGLSNTCTGSIKVKCMEPLLIFLNHD